MSTPTAERQPRVVIGAAGTASAFGVARTLHEHWPDEVAVIATDVNPKRLVAASAFAAEYVQSPPIADSTYRAWLASTLEQVGATFYVPLLDEDIAIAAELLEQLQLPPRVHVCAPSAASARVCLDKLATCDWLRAHDLPACETWAPEAAPWREGGLIAKPRLGVGSAGVRLLASVEELEGIRDDRTLVVQPRCAPPEVTIDSYLGQDGRSFRAVCRERLEVKGGVCMKARVFEDEELSGLAEAVARGLGLAPASCIQVMRGPEGGWSVTDVNARPGGGSRLSAAAGVDVLGASFADVLRLPFDAERALAPLEDDVYAVRQYDEYVVG